MHDDVDKSSHQVRLWVYWHTAPEKQLRCKDHAPRHGTLQVSLPTPGFSFTWHSNILVLVTSAGAPDTLSRCNRGAQDMPCKILCPYSSIIRISFFKTPQPSTTSIDHKYPNDPPSSSPDLQSPSVLSPCVATLHRYLGASHGELAAAHGLSQPR